MTFIDRISADNGALVKSVVLAILALSLAAAGLYLTFSATSDGTMRLLPTKIAVPLTIVVMFLLAAMSWAIGDKDLRAGGYGKFAIVIYVIVVLFCWFFSFSSYLSQSTTMSGAVYADFERSLKVFGRLPVTLEEQLKADLRNQQSGLKSEPAIGTYVDQLIALEAQFGDQPADIQTKIAEAQENNLTAARESREDLNTEVEDRTRALDSSKDALVEKTDELSIAEAEIARLTLEVAEIDKAMSEELNKDSSERLPADGPASKLLPDTVSCNRERARGKGDCTNSLAALKTSDERSIAQTNAQILTLQGDISDLDREIKDQAADLEGVVRRRDTAAEFANQLLAATQGQEISQGLSDSARAFQTDPSFERYAALERLCDVYRSAGDSQSTTGSSVCISNPLTSLFRDLATRNENIGSLEQTCDMARNGLDNIARDQSAQARALDGVTPVIHREAYDAIAAQVIEPCLVKAEELGFDIETVRADIDAYRRAQDPDVDELERAGWQFLNVLTLKSTEFFHYFAFFASGLQELIMLGAKILWEVLRPRAGKQSRPAPKFNSADAAVAGLLLDVGRQQGRDLILPRGYDDIIDSEQRPFVSNLLHELEKLGLVSETGFPFKQKRISSEGKNYLYALRKSVLNAASSPPEEMATAQEKSGHAPQGSRSHTSGRPQEVIIDSSDAPYARDDVLRQGFADDRKPWRAKGDVDNSSEKKHAEEPEPQSRNNSQAKTIPQRLPKRILIDPDLLD